MEKRAITMKSGKRRGRKIGKKAIACICTLAVAATLLGAAYTWMEYSRFAEDTYIQNVDCSRLNVEQAKEKIETELKQQQVQFLFSNNIAYDILGEQLGLGVASEEEVKAFWKEQKDTEGEAKTFMLMQTLTLNETALKEYLHAIPELQESNMREPQNAYVKQEENGFLTIIPEIEGNKVDFAKAYQMTLESIKSGKYMINMVPITKIEPEIRATTLQERTEQINSILQTTIQFKLPDGSVSTLDSSITKNWISQTEDGSFTIEIDENTQDFVKTLSNKVSNTSKTVPFEATGIGKISVPVQSSGRTKLNQEAICQKIKEILGSAKEETISLIYMQKVDLTGVKSYVEIDLTRQKVWIYKDGKCLKETDCVTGTFGTRYATPTGVYHLTYKTTNATLRGRNSNGSTYASFVKYWMPFNGGIGLHDASWREKRMADGSIMALFGGNIYKTNGSHGCVNLPTEAAKIIYENIDNSMPIIVYAS